MACWCNNTPAKEREVIMPRQSITLTENNDTWLKHHVENAGDYSNKSELVNDLIRRARRAEAVNLKLEQAEKRGFVEQAKHEILSEFKRNLK